MPKNSHLEWKVKYEPGVLEAKGIKNGKTYTDRVETTGVSYTLLLTPDRPVIKADGEDVCVLNISAIDEKGREVPVADNSVKFEITGNGKIIGVGNGNPSCHEPDKYLNGIYKRSLFNGKCQVIIQSTRLAGEITVKAISDRLRTASVVIKTEKCEYRPFIK
jgi:beta-galactosidase